MCVVWFFFLFLGGGWVGGWVVGWVPCNRELKILECMFCLLVCASHCLRCKAQLRI